MASLAILRSQLFPANVSIVSTTTPEALTILLVEDDELDAHVASVSLKRFAALERVVVAPDGAAALRLLQGGHIPHPMIIVVDLNMPIMGGLEFVDRLRADPDFASTVVFVHSTSCDPSDIRAAYAHNVAGYVVKDHEVGRLGQLLKAYREAVQLA